MTVRGRLMGPGLALVATTGWVITLSVGLMGSFPSRAERLIQCLPESLAAATDCLTCRRVTRDYFSDEHPYSTIGRPLETFIRFLPADHRGHGDGYPVCGPVRLPRINLPSPTPHDVRFIRR